MAPLVIVDYLYVGGGTYPERFYFNWENPVVDSLNGIVQFYMPTGMFPDDAEIAVHTTAFPRLGTYGAVEGILEHVTLTGQRFRAEARVGYVRLAISAVRDYWNYE